MTRARPYDRDTALQAAMQLFWEKGYHATSLKDLEEALSMKPGSIYAAFHSKENLFLASLERYFQQGREAFEQTMGATGSPLGALASHLRRYADHEAAPDGRRSCMIVKTLLDTTAQDADIARQARQYLDEMKAAFEHGFEAAKDAGELPPEADPARLATRYQANIAALRIEAHRSSDPAEVSALASDMVEELEALRA